MLLRTCNQQHTIRCVNNLDRFQKGMESRCFRMYHCIRAWRKVLLILSLMLCVLPKWPPSKSHLTYAFDSDYPNNYIPPVVRAFNTWTTSSNYFTFSRVGDIQGADLKIAFERPQHGDADFEPGVLAHAYAPTDGRFHYNSDASWSVGPGPVPNRFDLETVALHEIGHLLGLGHSQYRDAVMFSGIPAGAVKGLNFDDIQGIKVLYGIK